MVGGVASSRVPPGIATGDVVTSWLNPTSILGGVLAVLVCAYLAAVFLCLDARREGHDDLADQFRIRALGTAATTGAVGLVGIFVLRADAPLLFDGLIGRALPVLVVSGSRGWRPSCCWSCAATGSPGSPRPWPWRRPDRLGVAQYPYLLLPYLTIEDAPGAGRRWWR